MSDKKNPRPKARSAVKKYMKTLFLVEFKMRYSEYPDKSYEGGRDYRLVRAKTAYEAVYLLERTLSVDDPYGFSKHPIKMEAHEIIE
jgi:hypothetical protein